MKYNPFFIVGVGRSGTTLIRLMLNSHPNLAIPYETHFLTKYITQIDRYKPLNSKESVEKLIKDMLSEDLLKQWDVVPTINDVISRLPEKVILADVIDAIYSFYAEAHGKKRWGDKSDYLSKMNEIHQVFPDTQFIHIIRDGRDVANSVMKMSWGPSDIIEAAEWWREYVRLGRCMGMMLPDNQYMEIRYEDLVLEPEVSLRKICNFLGEPYSNEMLEFYKTSESLIPESRKSQHYNANSPPQSSRTYAWKKSMRNIDVALFEIYASDQLQEFGYELKKYNYSIWRKRLAKFTVLFKRLV
jgi:hypothetical protein